MDWQTVVSLLVVGWAGWFLVRQWLRTAHGDAGGGCHACDDCPARSTESRLVSLREDAKHSP